jgi:diguanylate cyclase (GGDEF)-like protein
MLERTPFNSAYAGRAVRLRESQVYPRRTAEELVLLWLAALGLLCLGPFALWHLIAGQWVLGAISILVVMVDAAAALYVWRSRDIRIGGAAFTVGYMLGALGALYVDGASLMYWAYPAMAASYLFVPVRVAIAINALVMMAMIPVLAPALPSMEMYRVAVTLVMVNLIACLFAGRMLEQRDRLTRLATRDTLTGVGNRRALRARMGELIALFKRRGDAMSLLLLDVDFFKKINDELGHVRGDQLLAALAEAIGSRIRLSDGLFRYGGDEFVVLLQNASALDASVFAEQLRERIEASAAQFGQRVTVSIGVAALQAGESEDAWLQRADAALYRAKQAGRNNSQVA